MSAGRAVTAGSRDATQRRLNGVALLLLAAGVALYLFALWRMEALAGGSAIVPAPNAPPRVANLDRWHALRRLSNAGLALAVTGVVAVIGATIRHTLRTRRLRDHGQADRT